MSNDNHNEAKYDLGVHVTPNKTQSIDVRMTPWQARRFVKLHTELATLYRMVGFQEVADQHMATVASIKAILAQIPKGK